jgi:hypothetical protein
MAGFSGGGKSQCPVCGATSNNSSIGRDGSPRFWAGLTMTLSSDAEIVRRRGRAQRIRQQNALGGLK